MADKIRVLLTEEEVDKRINEVAEQINKDYAGKSVHLICILKGGVFFTMGVSGCGRCGCRSARVRP